MFKIGFGISKKQSEVNTESDYYKLMSGIMNRLHDNELEIRRLKGKVKQLELAVNTISDKK